MTHKAASDGEVKLDGNLTQHCLGKQALNFVGDDDHDVIILYLFRVLCGPVRAESQCLLKHLKLDHSIGF